MGALYELTGAFRQLMDAIVDWETGEIDEDRVPNFAAILAQIEGDLDDKLDGCAKALKMMDVDIAGLKDEEARLAKRRKSIEANKANLKGYMRGCLEQAGITKRKTRLFTIFMSKPRKKLDIPDEAKVPPAFRKVQGPPPPDNELIRKKLMAGEKFDWARLVEGDPPLTVR